MFDCQRLQGKEKGSAILEGEKRKPVSKRYKVSVLIKSEWEKDTEDGDREGIEEGIEKWNREVKEEGRGRAGGRQRV